MRRLTSFFAWTAALATWLTANVAEAGEVRIDARTFTLPDRYSIERVATAPLVDRPIVADFDEQGRLYVADSSGTSENVQKQLEERPHRVVRLEDTDGDGRFDRSTVFADRMMFPEGALWRDGSLYVSAPPSIWKLTDTDGDGIADRREEWFQGKTLTGCANDLHGPYAGRDGRIYWCKGAFAEQTYERPGKPPLVTRAAHIFRTRPDGSGIEPVMTGGMDNPVDVVFTPGGERIFTTTFLQHPGGGRRDGLIHAIYGGVYGKVHDVIEGHPRTNPEVMPVLVHLGPAAPAGLALAESEALGFKGNLFAALFNMQKVTRHELTPAGATFTTRDSDLVVCDDRDFHPTDVIEDADGSLLIVDTGGWYKLCCPTSQLGKPDVLGAIYRVRKDGMPRVADPRGNALDWGGRAPAELVERLDSPSPAVRRRAIEALGTASAVPALADAIRAGDSAELRRNAVWAATRIETGEARAAARTALADRDAVTRQAAIHSAGLWRDPDAAPKLRELLTDARSTQNQRAAAEALGRIGDKAAIPALLDVAATADDRVLEHSALYALIEIDDPQATADALKAADTRRRRAALIALDQMGRSPLTAAEVAPLLDDADPALAETAAWVVGRHPEWADALAGPLGDRLDRLPADSNARATLEGQLARFSRAEPIQKLLADRLTNPNAPRLARESALRAIARSALKTPPADWLDGIARVLGSADISLDRLAIAAARSLNIPKDRAADLRSALRLVADRDDADDAFRLDALAAVPGGLDEVPRSLFDFLLAQLDPAEPVAVRLAAADVLAKASLSSAQLTSLADATATAGPLEVGRLLTAFERSTDPAVGRALVSALRRSAAGSALRIEVLKPTLDKFGPELRDEANALYAALSIDAVAQRAQLEELLSQIKEGDIRRGQAVFNGTKAACVTCHAIGYIGGKVGPDLTRIGQVREARDLLESIVFPSASFVRSYEPIVVATTDGHVVSGVLRQDNADGVVLAVSATEEARIARDDIEEIKPGTVSVMPAGLDKQLTTQELADLVEFLKACK